MDPNWDSCPYCAAEQRSNQKTSMAQGKPTIVLEPTVNTNNPERRTIVGDIPRPSPGGPTMVLPSEASNATLEGSQFKDTRKIVGALVTYSWVPGGQLFPIREGRNYIGIGGAGTVSSGQGCDIQVPQDAKMSRVHALILCRSGKNEIIDQQSSNGTFLNGEMLFSNQSVHLDHNAEIKTGSTLWTFIKIESPPVS